MNSQSLATLRLKGHLNVLKALTALLQGDEPALQSTEGRELRLQSVNRALAYQAQSLGFDPQHHIKKGWKPLPVVPSLGKQRQVRKKFKVIFSYKPNFRSVCDTYRPITRTKTNKQKTIPGIPPKIIL